MGVDINGNQFYQATAGLNNVASFQVSAIPWASSSLVVPPNSSTPLEISFPLVTKDITIKNTSFNTIKVGFSSNGIQGTNYFSLSYGESYSSDLKISKLYLLSADGTSGQASVVAGLTAIPAAQLSSNWSGSAGVG